MKKYQLFLLHVLLLSFHSASSCTFFTRTYNGQTLVGNNEDYSDPYAKYWIQPSAPGKFGGVYFGWTNGFPQGGMNEQGLVYDGFAIDAYEIPNSNKATINPFQFIQELMATCSNIKEVVKYTSSYNLSFLSKSQLMFVDATGASVIIDGNDIHYKTGDYQVCTNFRLSTIQDKPISCSRYSTCQSLLPKSEVNIESFKNILKQTHQEGEISTQYSNIYDPINKIVYLYHFHNYDTAVVIDLKKEWSTQRKSYFMHEVFQPDRDYVVFQKNYDSTMVEKLNSILKNPGHYSIWDINRLAGEFFRLKKTEQALDLLRANVNARPDSYIAHAGLAEVEQTAGHRQEAINHYKKSMQLNPKQSEEDQEIWKDCEQSLGELQK